jgi:hypothetical protein
MSYSPPPGNNVGISFLFAGYSPPEADELILSFSSGELQVIIDAIAGSSNDLTTSITFASGLGCVANISAELGNDYEEAIYVENFMTLIV